jgi:hypothetical protein
MRSVAQSMATGAWDANVAPKASKIVFKARRGR